MALAVGLDRRRSLLSTFEEELGAVALVPNAEGGVFEVRVAGEPIFSRAEAGRLPEIWLELKRLVRDRVAPGRDLGTLIARLGGGQET